MRPHPALENGNDGNTSFHICRPKSFRPKVVNVACASTPWVKCASPPCYPHAACLLPPQEHLAATDHQDDPFTGASVPGNASEPSAKWLGDAGRARADPVRFHHPGRNGFAPRCEHRSRTRSTPKTEALAVSVRRKPFKPPRFRGVDRDPGGPCRCARASPGRGG